MISEVENSRNRTKINNSSSNKQTSSYQKQSASNNRRSNNMDNQKKQVASFKQSILPTNKLNQEDLSDQANHLESSDFGHPAVASNRLQDVQSDSPCQEQSLQQQIDQRDEDQGKHHVGPVMGIFFKVWSLVKVTKGRHHQKMRRQNSEDANQFQYISGDQMSGQPSSLQANNQHLGGDFSQQRAQMLEDRHFRRAGSQPAPSSSHRQQANDLFAPQTFSDRLLQVSSSNQQSQRQHQQQQQQQQQPQLSAMSSGTNSTSSGVSSTTSSQLAPTVATQQSTPVSSSVRRHLSAYNLLRSTPELPTPSISSAQSGCGCVETIGQHKLSTSSKAPTSWTSKIKRSATTVNQTDFSSYVSKYRSSRRSGCPSSAVVNAQKHVVSAPPVSLAKATPTTNHGFFRRRLNNYTNNNNKFFTSSSSSNEHNMINKNDNNNAGTFIDHSDDYGGEEEDEAGGQEEEEGEEEEDYEEEEEDDSNDIYSTPNDSIQSVPSTAPVICNNDKFSNNFAAHQASSLVYPIIKSFSTNNFNQQQSQSQHFKTSSQETNNIVTKSTNRFEPIEESKVINTNRDSNFQRQDSSQSNSKRLNGSRFFISSSSSEDSSSPPNQQQRSTSTRNQNQDHQHQVRKHNNNNHHHNNNMSKHSNNINNNSSSSNNEIDKGRQNSLLNQQASFQLEQQQNKLAIQHGVHYHNPTSNSPTHQAAILRPDSLVLAATTQASSGSLFLPVGLQTFTPTSTGIMVPSGGAALAAMSPIDTRCFPNPSSAFSQRTRLNLIEQSTRGSNSNISSNLRQSVSSMLNQVHHSYKKSPSLFEFSNGPTRLLNSGSRFSSRYPSSAAFNPSVAAGAAYKHKSSLVNGQLFSGLKPIAMPRLPSSSEAMRQLNNFSSSSSVQQHRQHNGRLSQCSIPNSISLYDYKSISQDKDFADNPMGLNSHRMSTATTVNGRRDEEVIPFDGNEETSSEYKFAQILLESGSNLNAKDSNGYTALMHAILSDNVPAIKCLIEHQVNLNEVNNAGLSALDLVCSKSPTELRVEILKMLIDNKADIDKCREGDGSRLLDRLIHQHEDLNNCDKLAFIECLLQNGAKLGSSTWLAAYGKYEIQLRLLRKLCQDGYYLYKKLSIEAAVYRFEYALKRIAELEQQLSANGVPCNQYLMMSNYLNSNRMNSKQQLLLAQVIPMSIRQLKYQIYLGLSRCERKRKFYKRALEFAHMAILVDSTAYEGYYSKAHILKDLGETDDSLITIDQTSRLVDKSIENIKIELEELHKQQEALIFDSNCFNMRDSQESNWIEATRIDLMGNIDYMEDAKKYILRLKDEILDTKLGRDTKTCPPTSSPVQEKPDPDQAFCGSNNQQSLISVADENNTD